MGAVYIGTAGWAIPHKFANSFATCGHHLERYANVLRVVEINTTFYRSHKPEIYLRWAASPPGFLFAVKAPRLITHFARLANVHKPLWVFLAEAGSLGKNLGPILFQLPPSLKFEAPRAEKFFKLVRELYRGEVVCEPRHPGWFTDEADQLLRKYQVARAIADPRACPTAASWAVGRN